jgi:hypothetical protein
MTNVAQAFQLAHISTTRLTIPMASPQTRLLHFIFLQRNKNISPNQIGSSGSSEGRILATQVAVRSQQVGRQRQGSPSSLLAEHFDRGGYHLDYRCGRHPQVAAVEVGSQRGRSLGAVRQLSESRD